MSGESIDVSLARRLVLMSGLGPTAEILSFAWPKESIQRKGHPTFRLNPALLAFAEGFRKGLPAPPKTSGIPAAPLQAILAKSCDARGGITGVTLPRDYKRLDDIDGLHFIGEFMNLC